MILEHQHDRYLTINKEWLKDCLEEMKPLLHDHWEEVAAYPDKIRFDPQYDRYIELEKLGAVRTFVVRFQHKMVGYFVFFTVPHMHYKGTTYAQNDIVYIKPEHRGKHTPAMFEYVEHTLKTEGLDVVTYHMKTYAEFHELMEYLEYDHMEHIYTKYIGD